MLLQLDVRNIALIDQLSLEIAPGLNILTGETGAGKSILIDAINAVLGERIARDIIRNGKEKAFIEAVFEYENAHIDEILGQLGIDGEDGSLILSREISIAGKNTCRVNGRLVNVSVLREIGAHLLDIHGQHDNQSLLKTEKHIELLDAFGGTEIGKIKTEYIQRYDEYKKIKARIAELMGDKGEIARRLDMLNFQIDEIKTARLKKGEDETLEKKRQLLANSERIMNSLAVSYEMLNDGTLDSKSVLYYLNKALYEITSIVRYDETLRTVGEKLESVIYQLEDICGEIRDRQEDVEFDPSALSSVEERLDIIARLKRKYGVSIEEVLEFLDNSQREYDELVQSESLAEKLHKELADIEKHLMSCAQKLHLARESCGAVLENNICQELENLEMKNAKFKVNLLFGEKENRFTKNGIDTVEFLISANAGEPLKPLSKIASGGEMSRIMLAIKTILADVDAIPTLIFDEIDTGISGKAAQKVSEKLSYIAKNHQVLCVTHLSQLACMADNHLYIEKISNGESTFTSVKSLDRKGRIDEIARIIGGTDITPVAVKHAEELITAAENFKAQ